ncbi:predicted protein, partial [Arabidopsis lyrata subsp. lyrata]
MVSEINSTDSIYSVDFDSFIFNIWLAKSRVLFETNPLKRLGDLLERKGLLTQRSRPSKQTKAKRISNGSNCRYAESCVLFDTNSLKPLGDLLEREGLLTQRVLNLLLYRICDQSGQTLRALSRKRERSNTLST